MDKHYLVTKSNYFIMNSSYDLSLEEQKIILTLASMVQPTDEEFKSYNFRIAEFMELLGVEDKSKYTEIPKITKELMKKVLEIQEGSTLLQVAWLNSVRYEKGSGMVTLKFSPDLKPYMLQLKEKFTQYQLANILSMKSKYSPRVYEILKCNEFKKQGYIEIEISDLRKLLKADNVYPLYNDFKRFVIERTQKELKKTSDISFDFEEVKTGRKVTSIKFYIKSNKIAKDPKTLDQISVTLVETLQEEEKESDDEVIRKANLISEVQRIMMINSITELEAKKILSAANDDIKIIKEKYQISRKTPGIKNIVAWLISAIKDDYKSPKNGEYKHSFNDYQQRKYDGSDGGMTMSELERKLLGWDDIDPNEEETFCDKDEIFRKRKA